jgi:hypothetical protein
MSEKTKELLRRLLSLRNVVPVLIVVGAFIGTFVPKPFGLERDQLLLGLLAFLAVDALIERLELLTNIEKDVDTVKNLVSSKATAKDFLRHRRDFPRLEHLITDANKEIWVSGVTLDSMVALIGVFHSKLTQGFRLKLLAVSPEQNTVRETSDYFGVDLNELTGRLKANLDTLYKRLVQPYPQQVEIRIINHRPALGYFIVDPHLEQGYMTVLSYLYRVEGSDRPPMFLLSRRTEPYWFDIYFKDFELLWSSATKLELT